MPHPVPYSGVGHRAWRRKRCRLGWLGARAVTPAEAGVQALRSVDSRLRGNDGAGHTFQGAIVTPAEAGGQALRPVDSRFPRLREGDSGNDGGRDARPTQFSGVHSYAQTPVATGASAPLTTAPRRITAATRVRPTS